MNWLEARFRRKFEPDGEGYRFHLPDRTVRYSAEEVEKFVADWRRSWLNPWLWSAFLLIGIAGPVAVSTLEFRGWEIAVLAAALIWLWCGFGLMMSQMAPTAAAARLESVGPGRPTYRYGLLLIAVGLLNLAITSSERLFGNWSYLLWGAMMLMGVADLVRNHRRRNALLLASGGSG